MRRNKNQNQLYMRAVSRLVALCALLYLTLSTQVFAQRSTTDWSIATLDAILASTPPGQKTALVGDMEILVTNLRAWRDELAGARSPRSAFDGTAPIWANGNVYYQFSNNVSAVHQQCFVDAVNEWAIFANLHFIPRTTQTNFITVFEDPALSGGQSSVGMIGGEQFLHIGPNAWNRGTLCHESGHALGLIHEHQRSDRDSYVSILTNNLADPNDPNFIKLSNSHNQGSYDFLSVMHYSRNTFSIDPSLDTIEPLAPYIQFINIMGQQFDPVLSATDRAGMAATYGSGPALSGVVTNTQDSGPGSLRAAMYYALDHPGTTITFNIPTSDPRFTNGIFTIQPTDGFPSIANNTAIDGSTEPGNQNQSGPAIQINGALAQPPSVFPNGLRLAGSNSVINRLIVNGFPATGVLIDGTNAIANVVTACFLGIDATGNTPVTNGFCPLTIDNGARSNIVGGLTVAARNIISGSAFQGMTIRDPGTAYNVVEGNYIGLNGTGTSALPSLGCGVGVFGGAQSNIIGGAISAAHNVISGNTLQGLVISDTNTDGNIVIGNYIGLSPSGTFSMANGWAGIDIFGGPRATVVQGNTCSGNSLQGIAISGAGTSGTRVQGNYIGLDAFGQNAVPNGWSGINFFNGAQSNIVGGLTPALRNVISGNSLQGIVISDAATSSNVIEGNYIGTNPNGTAAIANGWAGVDIFGGANNNLIGGPTPAARNVISGNGLQGIAISQTGTANNIAQGNFIGLNTSGNVRVPNGASGILIYNSAQSNTIGGSVSGTANVISGNANQGVAIFDPGTMNNLVAGNLIGVAADGSTAISNTWSGVELGNSAQSNLIGGGPGARNIISGNGNYGVLIAGTSTAFNIVQGNTIGLNVASAIAAPNSWAGISIFGGAQSNQIGGTIAGNANIIAANLSDGVQLFDPATTGNTVRGNSIFSNSGAGLILYNSANGSINSPSLTSAVVGTNTIIRGTFSGSANTTFHLDFYASPSTQAPTYLGARDATTAANGSVTFTNSFAALIPAGRIITATATDPSGDTSSLSSGIAVQTTSTVNDGIPDAWRARYFGGAGTTTNNQSCATCDADGDGMNNLQEFLAGTNPTNASSALFVTEYNTNKLGGITGFNSSTGVVYRLEVRDDFNVPGWSVFTDQLIGTGTNIVVIDPNSAALPRRFYRARVLW